MKWHKKFLQLIVFFTLVAALFLFVAPEEKNTEENYATEQTEQKELKDIKTVQLIVDGQELEVNTEKKLVGEILEETEIILNPEDKVIPALDEIAEDKIQVVRICRKVVEEKKTLSFNTEERSSEELYKGEIRILQKGEKGIEKNRYEVILEDGQEIARNFVEKVIIKKPVKQIVSLGTRQVVSRGGNTLEFAEAHTMTATAYTHTGNRTATGIWPSVGIVAVDPRVIPLGTRLYIDKYGFATAADVGSSIKGKRIDVFLETKEEALHWGRRQVQVFVLHNE
ncbi:MAG: 3D domain-containing protein [Bacilli bacterium]|nr:3D domain-containing protein [Clostridia bacterium]MDD4146164.1 3D domain-containing protein [Clostridia bacterium]MDD4665599.1 3D domain-containing protein [Clostridia bacterium]